VLTGLAEAPLVTVAAVDGHALGAGVQLSGFADLRVATPTSTFGVPAAKLGIAVDQATIARVVELCGGGAARAMLLAAATFDGTTAHQLGFVSKLGDLGVALAWASEIAALAPLTIAAHKQALSSIRVHMNGPGDLAVRAAFERAWSSSDLQEGRSAFLERRTPRFTGR
jgi:enoyl-CoA hydratase